MKKCWGLLKISLVILWIVLFVIHSSVFGLFKRGDRRRRFQIELISAYARRLLKALGYHVEGQDLYLPDGAFIVANHLSYMDILCIAALSPCIFVTSTEMRDTPFLGLVCRFGGSIFVNRKCHFVSRSELREIRTALASGFRVVVFPEATTTDGSGLLPFKRGLFRAAQEANVPLVGLCVNYEEMITSHSAPQQLNRICYFGDDEFAEHLVSLVSTAPLRARLSMAYLSGLEGSGDLRSVVKHCRQHIEALFRPMVSEKIETQYVGGLQQRLS